MKKLIVLLLLFASCKKETPECYKCSWNNHKEYYATGQTEDEALPSQTAVICNDKDSVDHLNGKVVVVEGTQYKSTYTCSCIPQ